MNIEIANRQFVGINEMVDFVLKQNYRGEEYDKRRKNQIEATKYWLNTFFPDDIQNRSAIQDVVNGILKKNTEKVLL